VDENELKKCLVSTVRKLTEPDKQEILKLYRESAETTSTLADRYGVSNSTISRLLKSTLPEDEYEYLVSLKRAARTPEGRAQVNYENVPQFSGLQPETEDQVQLVTEEVPPPPPPVVVVEEVNTSTPEEENDSYPVIRRVKRRSSAVTPPIPAVKPPSQPIAEQLELLAPKQPEITNIQRTSLEDSHPEANAIAQMFGEELLDESEEDLEDLDDLDEDEDEEYLDDDEDYEVAPRVSRPRSGEGLVRVLPLSAASLPKTCYLVIDRSSELITRPLKDFGDLGQIPNLETQQRTLPIFDNHRVAKRFSTKRDRVIKVPDSKMLHKARYHLQAKGITRLLIDGQVYSLSSSTV
jgi:transcriptional regulator with XRE-family HTH domain